MGQPWKVSSSACRSVPHPQFSWEWPRGRLNFPLQDLGQGYLAHLSECSVFSWLAEGHHPLGATAVPRKESCGTSCCASGGRSFPHEPAVIHGTSSQEEAVRLNQCCLKTCEGEGTERGRLQPCVFSGIFLPASHPPAFAGLGVR